MGSTFSCSTQNFVISLEHGHSQQGHIDRMKNYQKTPSFVFKKPSQKLQNVKNKREKNNKSEVKAYGLENNFDTKIKSWDVLIFGHIQGDKKRAKNWLKVWVKGYKLIKNSSKVFHTRTEQMHLDQGILNKAKNVHSFMTHFQ